MSHFSSEPLSQRNEMSFSIKKVALMPLIQRARITVQTRQEGGNYLAAQTHK